MAKNVNIKIKADSQDAESGLNRVTKKLKEFSGEASRTDSQKFIKAATGAAKSFNIWVAAINAVISGIKKLGDGMQNLAGMTNSQIKAETQLTAAAKNNPYLTASSVTKLKNYASQLQEISSIGDEELLPQMAKLAAEGRSQEEIMKIMSAAVDMNAAGVMNLDSAVDALNATYGGTAGTLGKQIPQIKSLTKEEMAEGKAVEIVANSYKNMAASVKSAAGSKDALNAAKGDFKEAIGSLFKPFTDGWNRIWTDFYNKGIKAIEKIRRQKITVTIDTGNGLESKTAQQLVSEIGEEARNTQYNNSATYQKLVDEYWAEHRKAAEEDFLFLKDKLLKDGYTVEEMEKIYAEQVEEALEREKSEFDDFSIVVQTLLSDSKKYSDDAIEALASSFKGAKFSDLDKETTAIMNAVQAEARARENAEKERNRQAVNAANEADRAKKAVEAKEAYEAELAAYEKEVSYRRQMGEEITEEEEVLGRISVMQNGILELVKEDNNVSWDNWTVQNKYVPALQAQYELYARITKKVSELAGIKDADSLITKLLEYTDESGGGGYAGEIDSMTATLSEYLAEKEKELAGLKEDTAEYSECAEAVATYRNRIQQLNDLKNPVIIKELREQTADLEDEIKSFLGTAGGDLLSDTIQTTIDSLKQQRAELEENSEAWEAYTEKIAELAELREQVIAKEQESTKENVFQTMNEIMNQVTDCMTKLSEIAGGITSIATQNLKQQQNTELDQISEQYTSGLISYEDYCSKKGEINKKAAREQYKVDLWEYYANLATGIANVAQGVTAALAGTPPMNFVNAGLTAAAGAVQIATLTANRPRPPSFATGGIVPGTSYTGDRVRANVNSGEMILNAAQQRNLWELANSGTIGGAVALSVPVTVNNNTNAKVSTSFNGKALQIVVDDIVAKSMTGGRYNGAMTAANVRDGGLRYL